MTTYRLEILVEGKDSASGVLGRVTSAFGGLGNVVGGILGANLLMNLGHQIIEFGKSAIGATATMQSMQIGLESLVARELKQKDATLDMTQALDLAAPAAGKLLEQIRKLAIQSPYELGTVQDTFRLAMAFGFASDEALSFTNGILNMAAGIGASDEMMGRMAYNLAQIRMQGKVTAVDVRQLAMAGFDLVGALRAIGEAHGLNIETTDDFNKAIEQGKLKWEDFAKDFENYANQNFGGAAQRLSQTLQGLKSTFNDLFILTMPKVLGPTVELVTSLLQDILGSFINFSDSGALDVLGTQLADRMKPGIDALREFLTEIGIITPEAIDERYREGINKLDFSTAIKAKLASIDWNSLAQKFLDGAVGLSKDFALWVESIDWQEVSDNISKGIDKIDWAMIGNKVRESGKNIWDGLSEGASEIDWLEIGVSAGTGLDNFLAGLTGQGNLENVITTWTNNLVTLFDIRMKLWDLFFKFGKYIISGWLSGSGGVPAALSTTIDGWIPSVESGMTRIKEKFLSYFNQSRDQASIGLAGGGTKIHTSVIGWLPETESALDRVKKTFFNYFQGAVQQAITALAGMSQSLVKAIENLISQALGALKPIVISVVASMPNFELLLQQIYDFVAEANAAMGSVNGESKSPRTEDTGGGGGGGSGPALPTLTGGGGLNSGRIYDSGNKGGSIGTYINVQVNVASISSSVDLYQLAYQIASEIKLRKS